MKSKGIQFRFRMILLVLIAGVVLIGSVYLSASITDEQYEINMLDKDIQTAERSVRNLEVQIKTASNITNLEAKAFDLGLIYPTFDQIVYLEKPEEEIEDFALALMQTVYD